MPAPVQDSESSPSRIVTPRPGDEAALLLALVRRTAPGLFTLASLPAATLLFLVQPMIARIDLPLFGGLPGENDITLGRRGVQGRGFRPPGSRPAVAAAQHQVRARSLER